MSDAALSPAEITRVLHDWKAGQQDAADRLIPIVYRELKALASRQLAREWRMNHLQTTEIVNEACVKLLGQHAVDWQNRGHFFAIAAQLMRRILVDHARRRNAAKRDPGPVVEIWSETQPQQIDVILVDQALERLSTRFPRHAQVVEMRFFGGLEWNEIAQVLDISLATVERDWRFAKAWLQNRMAS